MGLFSKGDKVTVTNPMQPTGHKGGETGTVIDSGMVQGTEVVQIREDATGNSVGVFPEEINHR
jgi:hypothetical protein